MLDSLIQARYALLMRCKSTNIWDDVRANRSSKENAQDATYYQGRYAHGHISHAYASRGQSTDDCRAATFRPQRTSRRTTTKKR